MERLRAVCLTLLSGLVLPGWANEVNEPLLGVEIDEITINAVIRQSQLEVSLDFEARTRHPHERLTLVAGPAVLLDRPGWHIYRHCRPRSRWRAPSPQIAV